MRKLYLLLLIPMSQFAYADLNSVSPFFLTFTTNAWTAGQTFSSLTVLNCNGCGGGSSGASLPLPNGDTAYIQRETTTTITGGMVFKNGTTFYSQVQIGTFTVPRNGVMSISSSPGFVGEMIRISTGENPFVTMTSSIFTSSLPVVTSSMTLMPSGHYFGQAYNDLVNCLYCFDKGSVGLNGSGNVGGSVSVVSGGAQIASFASNGIVTGTVFRGGNGSATAPLYSFSSALTAGMYFDTTDTAFSSNSKERLRLRQAGNIILGGYNDKNISSVYVGTTTTNQLILAVGSDTVKFQIDSTTATFGTSVIISSVTGTQRAYSLSVSSTPDFYHVAVTTWGTLSFNGSSPTISGCGATPAGACIACTNNAGTVQIGGTAPTACVINFNPPFKSLPGNPSCTITDNSVTLPAAITSITNAALTAGFGIGGLAGGLLYYHCDGIRE